MVLENTDSVEDSVNAATDHLHAHKEKNVYAVYFDFFIFKYLLIKYFAVLRNRFKTNNNPDENPDLPRLWILKISTENQES